MLNPLILKEKRVARGLTQQALAALIGWTTQNVWNLEHGISNNVRATTLEKLADALGCSTDALLGRESKRQIRAS